MIQADYDQWLRLEESRGDGWVDLAASSQIMTHRSFYPQASILLCAQYNSLELSFKRCLFGFAVRQSPVRQRQNNYQI